MSRLADSLSGTCNWRPYPSHVANSRIPSAVAPVVRPPPSVSSTVAAAARPSLPCLFSFTVSAFSRVRGGQGKILGHRPGRPVSGVASLAICHGQRGFPIWPLHVLSQPGQAGARFCTSFCCELYNIPTPVVHVPGIPRPNLSFTEELDDVVGTSCCSSQERCGALVIVLSRIAFPSFAVTLPDHPRSIICRCRNPRVETFIVSCTFAPPAHPCPRRKQNNHIGRYYEKHATLNPLSSPRLLAICTRYKRSPDYSPPAPHAPVLV